jgi:succinate dehydrogenase / fumarate reductase flavoprotein subunit
VNGALNRTESRGAHAREDFAARDDVNWLKHTLAWLDDATGKVRFDYRPVHMTPMTNDIASIPPKARVY